ncbi:MAG TPA: hypothetical protein VE093_45860, partial [Polyangiaceae bacterium]|nr:hypothetical protein [Polyangiaceae bacterium]
MRANLLLVALITAGLGTAVSVGACGDGDTSTSGGGEGGGAGGATTGTTTPTGSSSMGSSTVSTGTMAMPNKVGEACTADADCGMTGRCIKSSDDHPFLGGGPAGGYCSLDCMIDADCPGFIDRCLGAEKGKPGSCFQGCEVGPEPMTFFEEPDPDKCRGREDVACATIEGGGVCLPLCGSDSQCEGRACDPKINVCVDTSSMGLEMGEACNPMKDACAGHCASFLTNAPGEPMKSISLCTEYCVFGGAFFDAKTGEVFGQNDCGGLTGGICVFLPQNQGTGDIGFCSPACTTHDDCLHPDLWCTRIGPPGFYEPNGFCLPADPCTGPQDCNQQGAMGQVCAATKYGKSYCLSDKFDLGS